MNMKQYVAGANKEASMIPAPLPVNAIPLYATSLNP